MAISRQLQLVACLLVLATNALAQTTTSLTTARTTPRATTTTPPTSTRPSSGFTFLSSSPPAGNDSAPNGNNNNTTNSSGLVQYYFVFLALFIVCLALGIFFLVRRRRGLRARQRTTGRASALERDLSGAGGRWGATPATLGRRGWQGRWPRMDFGREEGLNEHGEAPPPYLPKRPSAEQPRTEGEELNAPAIPLETLSRDHIVLKPPDYSENSTTEVSPDARDPVASETSPRTHDRATTP